MPFTSPYDRPRLKSEIVARVAAGETLAAICAGPGMPVKESIQVWRRVDPAFRAALAAARGQAMSLRPAQVFDADVAAAFVARVERGERIADLLAKPGMPSQRAYAHWRRTHPGFAAEMRRLLGVRYRRRTGFGHGRWRAWDEAVADRITLSVMRGAVLRKLLATDRALPCLAVVERWRREHPDWDGALRMAMRTGRLVRERSWSLERVTPELTQAIGDRIVAGASLRSLATEPWAPCAGTLYKWVAISPEFAREVAAACFWREDMLRDRMMDICQRNGRFALARTRVEAAPQQLRVNQLAKRPGWKRRREAAAER